MSKPTIIFTAVADGPITNVTESRLVSQYNDEFLVLDKMVQAARTMASVTGSRGSSEVREVFGVTIELRWSREAAPSVAPVDKRREVAQYLFSQAN